MGVVRGWGRMDLSAGWLGIPAPLSGPTSHSLRFASCSPLRPRERSLQGRLATHRDAGDVAVGA
jgi:hypothetical protein